MSQRPWSPYVWHNPPTDDPTIEIGIQLHKNMIRLSYFPYVWDIMWELLEKNTPVQHGKCLQAMSLIVFTSPWGSTCRNHSWQTHPRSMRELIPCFFWNQHLAQYTWIGLNRYQHMGVSINWGYPKWMVYKGKFHLEMDDDWGYPLFMESPTCFNLSFFLMTAFSALAPVAWTKQPQLERWHKNHPAASVK